MDQSSDGTSLQTLKKLGFTGPYLGGKHQRMERGDENVPIPNPHEGDLSVGGLARLLKRIGVTRDEWERL